jgi:hypothetical protein
MINLIRSETWLSDNFEDISSILEETINEFVDIRDRIINIESKKSDNGMSRFWIYVESPDKLS